jgi:AraC-like DNA-binding protein
VQIETAHFHLPRIALHPTQKIFLSATLQTEKYSDLNSHSSKRPSRSLYCPIAYKQMTEFHIQSEGGNEWEVQPILPDHLKNLKIAQASPLYVNGPWGEMLFQHIPLSFGAIWDSWYLISRDTTLCGRADIAVTEMHTSVKNFFDCTWNNYALESGGEGTGGLSHMPHVDNTATFRANQQYHTFDLHLIPQHLENFVHQHPELDKLLNNAIKQQPAKIPNTLHLDANVRMLIQHLRAPDCSPAFHKRYQVSKAEELLMSALWRIDPNTPRATFKCTDDLFQRAGVCEAYLRSHVEEPILYADLARIAGTNIQYLKMAFMERYGCTMDQYHRRLRMEYTQRLMIEFPKEPLSMIAAKVGYSDSKELSKAFTRHFGFSPAQFRRSLRR